MSLSLLQIFLPLIGYELTIRDDKTVICKRLSDHDKYKTRIMLLNDFNYQFCLTQIFYHLQETHQDEVHIAILNAINDSLNEKKRYSKMLKIDILSDLYRNVWIRLYFNFIFLILLE